MARTRLSHRAAAVMLIVAILAMTAPTARAADPTPTPVPGQGSAGKGAQPAIESLSFTGYPIVLPRDGTIIVQTLPAAPGIILSAFGLDQPSHQQLIADAGHTAGVVATVGTFTAGTSLVFYISTSQGDTFLSTGNHVHIVPDGSEAWNIGWEDWIDFDYDDVNTRICYQQAGVTGCPRDAASTFGPGPDPTVVHQAEPVNTATGNYTTTVTDIAVPGRGLPLAFRRTYNSLSPDVGTLGIGWTHGYTSHLEFLSGGTVVWVGAAGDRHPYLPDGAGGFLRPPGVRAVLSAAAGGYDVLEPDQVRSHFDSTGVLQTIRDRNGNTITAAYSAGQLSQLTDTVGRVFTLTYTGGRLTGIAGAGLSVGYTYDAGGRLQTVTDVRGFATSYTYDAASRLASITDPNSHRLVLNTYGANGRVSEQVDARDNHTTFTWDAATETSTMTDARGGTWIDRYAAGVLRSTTDPLGRIVRYGFSPELQAAAVTDARGYEIDSVYDVAGNLTTRIYPAPLNLTERFTYDAQNNLLTAQDRNDKTTTMTYDAAGNLRTVTGPAPVNPVTTYNRDQGGTGLLVSLVDPRGKTTTYGYDSQANLNTVTTPLGFRTTKTYDPAGQMLTRVDPRGNISGADPAQYTTTFTVDGAGNTLTVTDPLNHTTTTTFDPAGSRTSVTDANNHTTSWAYDAANELTSVTDPRGKITGYTYDAVGNLATRTDANSHVTTFAYDLAHQVTTETRPLSRVWSYDYDANGNRTKIVDAIGNATPQTTDGMTTFTYDNLDRLTAIAYNGTPSVAFGYDGNGNRTSMTDNGTTTTYTYDVLNRMTQAKRGTSLRMDYTYDALNLLSRNPLGGTPVTYAYDDDERLTAMTANSATTYYAYDAAANVLSTTLPIANGYVESRTYDRAGRLTEVKNQKGSTVLSKATYTLDPVGNRTSIVSTTGTTTLTYDEDDRLTQACYTTACTGSDNFRRYTYDDVGNRLTEVSAAGTTTYAYDALDQLTGSTGVGGTVSYSFDRNGNQTAAGTRTFTYDVANRLATTTQGATTTTYKYDGDGRRISAATGIQANKTTKYLWDVNRPLAQLVRELDGNDALIREYRYGLDLVAMQLTVGGNPYYYHHDGLGSIANLTSATGVTQWTYQYHPYGVSRTTTKNNNQAPANLMQFTGQYLDPTGLYHLRARPYDPGTGRFLTTDPAPLRVSRPMLSTYVYATDNPCSRIDPSGRETKTPADYNVAECVSGLFGFYALGEAGLLLVAGGVVLQGGSITLLGVTFGGAAPVSGAGVVGGLLLEGAGLATEAAAIGLIYKTCVRQ